MHRNRNLCMNEPEFFAPQESLVQIHNTALRILSELGIHTNHSAIRDRLAAMGCRVDGARVFMPPEMVSEVVCSIPNSFRLFGRDPQTSVCVDAFGKTLFTNSGIFPNIYDFEGGFVRRSTLKDVETSTRLMDALANEDVIYVSLLDATEVPSHMATVTDMAAALANTTKPLLGPGVTSRAEAEAIIAMARAVRGGDDRDLQRYPSCVPFIAPTTPLKFQTEIVDALVTIAEAGLPLAVITNPVMGTTAPFTIAGTVAVGHAEVLATAVLAHAVHPGLPILSCNTPSIADMRYLISTTGGPETGLMRRTIVELSRSLGIPSWEFGHTSSARLDLQAADEKSINALLIASARPAVLGGLGALANSTLTSFETMVLDNERFGALRRILDGVSIDEAHLAFRVVADQVAGMDVIAHPHTLANLRSGEVWMPTLASRRGLVNGNPEPGSTLEKARTEARRIMDEHVVASLPEGVQARILEIMDEYNSSQSR